MSKLDDLNEYLFEELDRITNDDLSEEQLDKEIKRAASVTKIAQAIINNGNLALSAMNAANEYGFNAQDPARNIPKMLEVGER